MFEGNDKNLAIANSACFCSRLNGFQGFFDFFIGQNQLDFDFGQKIDNVFRAAIKFGVSFLPAKAFDFADSETLNARSIEAFLDFFQLKRLNDGLNFFHNASPIYCCGKFGVDSQELTKIIGQYSVYLQVEKGVRPSTRSVYLCGVRYFFSFCAKHARTLFLPETWKLQDIGVRELEFFFREHLQTRHWKINTVVSYLTSIRSFFHFLHEKGFLKKNPIRHYTMKHEAQELVIANISEGEIQQLFESPPTASFEGYRNRLMLEMFYGLGVPPTKLAQMESVEIASDAPVIHIHALQQIRTLPIAPAALEVLKHYLTARQRVLEQTQQPTTAFWINRSGKKLTRKKIIEIFKKELSRIGVIGEHVQILRNLSSKHFADHGADVRSLQTHRGMKSFQTLELFKDESFEAVLQQFKKMHIRESS